MITKSFQKEKSFHKKKENFWMNINLFWKLAVFCIVIVALCAFVFGYFLFLETNKEIIPPSTDEGRQAEAVKKERIEKVLNYFSERERRSNEILNFPAPIVDPSL